MSNSVIEEDVIAGRESAKKKSNVFWRILITTLGIALIFIAVSRLALFFFGETTYASVTTRRVGGADDARTSGQRYEWSVDYTFTDDKGVTHNGHTTKRGSDFSVTTGGSKVFYFTFAPFINALEGDAEPGYSQLLYICAGVFLIVVMNRRKKRDIQSKR